MTQYKAGLASLFSTHARRADLAPRQTCPQCERVYTLGVNGTIDGCDECTDTHRALNGYAIDEVPCTGTDPIRCEDPKCPKHGRR